MDFITKVKIAKELIAGGFEHGMYGITPIKAVGIMVAGAFVALILSAAIGFQAALVCWLVMGCGIWALERALVKNGERPVPFAQHADEHELFMERETLRRISGSPANTFHQIR